MQITVKNLSSRTKALRTGPGTRAILKAGQEALLDFVDDFVTKEKIDALALTGLLFYHAVEAVEPVEEEEVAPAAKTPAKAPAKTPAAAPKASSQAAGKAPADPTPAPDPAAPAAAAPAAPAVDAAEVPKAAPWQRGLEAPK